MTHFGIDLHSSFMQIAVADSGGRIVQEAMLGFNPEHEGRFQELLRKHRPRVIAVEACTGAALLRDQLMHDPSVGEVLLVDPREFRKRFPKRGKKTDRTDAANLALYAAYQGESIWAADPKVRDERQLASLHVALNEQENVLKNNVHGLLKEHHARLPQGTTSRWLWTKRGRAWLESTLRGLPDGARMAAQTYLTLLDCCLQQHEALETKIAQICKSNETVKLLMTHTGVGHLGAFVINSEIGDWRRFPKAKQLSAYAGLVPRVHQSAATAIYGRITKNGRRRLRWIAVECAIQAARRCPSMKALYGRILNRTKIHGKAKVACGRKLLERLWHIIRTGTPCRGFNEELYHRKMAKLARAAG